MFTPALTLGRLHAVPRRWLRQYDLTGMIDRFVRRVTDAAGAGPGGARSGSSVSRSGDGTAERMQD